MADFDIDFCQERRHEVIEYIRNKYNPQNVGNIVTFGTLQPKAVLRAYLVILVHMRQV